MPTKRDTSRQELTIEQRNAIDVLGLGKSDAETADAVGVSRTTITGWRNHHPTFIASLNSRRTEVWGTSADRLRALLPKALDCLEGAITGEAPDWRAAVKVVEMAGLDRAQLGALGPGSIGPAEAEAVIEAEVKRRRRDHVTDFMDGGRPTETEMRALLRELDALTG